MISGRFAGWFVLLTALTVAVGAAGAVAALRHHADEWRRGELLLGQIEVDAHVIGWLQQRAHLEGYASVPEYEAEVTGAWSSIAAGTAQLERLGAAERALMPVTTALRVYRVHSLLELGLVASGRAEQARSFHQLRLRSSFDAVTRAIGPASERYRAAAEHWNGMTDLGAAAGFTGGAGAIGVLFHAFVGTRRRAAEMEGERKGLRESEERFRSLVQNSSDAITVVDLDTTVRYESPSVERLLGYPAGTLVGRRLLDLVHPDDKTRCTVFLSDASGHVGVSAPIDWRLRARDGSWVPVETVASNLLEDPSWRGIVLNTRDISERKSLEEQLKHQAFHDPLTDLPNRALFSDRVDHALAGARRRSAQIAVLFLDLDDFKTVNDTMGHAGGDELLAAVARRLRASLRTADTAARLGGDEFAILLEDVGHVRSAVRVAERIMKALDQPLKIGDKRVSVHASIGIAVSVTGQEQADDLLRNADLAMYVAKAHGKARYEVFKPSMHSAIVERARVESELQRAVDEHELSVHYQPIVALRSGEIVALEALVRWRHAHRGFVSAASFLPLADEMGLMLPIGKRVLAEALLQAREWHALYGGQHPPAICVNLSARELLEQDIRSQIGEALEDSGLEARHVVVELGEAAVMQHAPASLARLRQLKEIGVRIALDDFGAGYSSLANLERLPIDIVKIDKSVVDGVGVRPEAAPLVSAVVAVARQMEIQTVAEGVERVDQVDELRALGCELAQGAYFSMPLPADGVTPLLIVPYTAGLSLTVDRSE